MGGMMAEMPDWICAWTYENVDTGAEGHDWKELTGTIPEGTTDYVAGSLYRDLDQDHWRLQQDYAKLKKDKRRTGRTSRMMEAARQIAEKGRVVYVLAASTLHADDLYSMAYKTWSDEELRSLIVMPVPVGFNWERMQIPGSNNPVLVDHYAIEMHLRQALAMLTMFDNQGDTR